MDARKRIEYLLDKCMEHEAMIEKLMKESGMEGKSSVLYNDKQPEFQKTIERLQKHIARQDKWLRRRKEEVTNLINALTECNIRKDFYKDKAAHPEFRTVRKRTFEADGYNGDLF